MLRIVLGTESTVVSQDEFIRQIEDFETAGFVGAPHGNVTVEAIDQEGRVFWRAYYGTFPELVTLAKQLLRERQAVSGKQ